MICFLLAGILILQEPVSILEGEKSHLCRPEGVAFAPDDQYIATVNSEGHSITLYPRLREGLYDSQPCQQIEGDLIRYPHDLEFTPSGRFLAVASRDNNLIHLFTYKGGILSSLPVFTLPNLSSSLHLPAGLSFSPVDETLAVANRAGEHSLVFYKKKGKSRYQTAPFYEITAELLREHHLSAPHAVAYAPDGKTFAVVHKRVCKNASGTSAFTIWDAEEMKLLYTYFLGDECIHSISYHPSGRYLAVTNEQEGLFIFEERAPHQFLPVASIPIDRRGHFEGAKGVAFSRSGRFLAVTTTWPAVLIFSIQVDDQKSW